MKSHPKRLNKFIGKSIKEETIKSYFITDLTILIIFDIIHTIVLFYKFDHILT